MKRNPAPLLGSLGLVALLSACSLAPKYEVPPTAEVATWKETGDWLPAAPADHLPRGAWWERFGDATLNELQQQLPLGSQDLRAAVARYDAARATARIGRSDLFPTIGASASASRAENSANTPRAAALRDITEDYSAQADFAWEIDLFGRLRNAAAASRERAAAAGADVASVELALRAQLASSYFALRGQDATIELLQDASVFYDGSLSRLRNRYQSGIAAATDVDQAQVLVSTTQSQLAAARLRRAQLEHAIAVLIGQPAASFTLPPSSELGNPPAIVLQLPAALLQRRPDIASAERNVAAANAGIGVARAAWFPVFSFGARGGYESATTSNWFTAPSRFWALGPTLGMTLLDAGRRTGVTAQARANYDAAAAQYRQATLVAYREVEDALAALHHLADVQAAEEQAAASALSSARHADQRYAAGIADYLEVTSTQTAALQSRRSALNARVDRLNAAVSLLRALGGDWDGSTAVADVAQR
jgi:outer membrane protein, multidrug efflux system